MRTIHEAGWTAVCGAVLMLMALPRISAAAEQGGMSGMQHGDHTGMMMDDQGKMKAGGHDMQKGEKIFSGTVGPWMTEARLIDMKAQLEQSGASHGSAARFEGRRHLMLFLTDSATGNLVAGVTGKVVVTGPDKASSSMVTLMEMGEHRFEHIGSDVDMPVPGKYTFKAEIESGGQKGNVTFSYTLK